MTDEPILRGSFSSVVGRPWPEACSVGRSSTGDVGEADAARGPAKRQTLSVARSAETRQRQRLAAASATVLPFGIAFLVVSVLAPASDVVFGAVLVAGAACSGVLDRIGNVVTRGWEKAYPPRRDLGLLLWPFDEWSHRPIVFAAQRLGLSAHRWVVVHYVSVGVLAAALVVLLIRIVVQE